MPDEASFALFDDVRQYAQCGRGRPVPVREYLSNDLLGHPADETIGMRNTDRDSSRLEVAAVRPIGIQRNMQCLLHFGPVEVDRVAILSRPELFRVGKAQDAPERRGGISDVAVWTKAISQRQHERRRELTRC